MPKSRHGRVLYRGGALLTAGPEASIPARRFTRSRCRASPARSRRQWSTSRQRSLGEVSRILIVAAGWTGAAVPCGGRQTAARPSANAGSATSSRRSPGPPARARSISSPTGLPTRPSSDLAERGISIVGASARSPRPGRPGLRATDRALALGSPRRLGGAPFRRLTG